MIRYHLRPAGYFTIIGGVSEMGTLHAERSWLGIEIEIVTQKKGGRRLLYFKFLHTDHYPHVHPMEVPSLEEISKVAEQRTEDYKLNQEKAHWRTMEREYRRQKMRVSDIRNHLSTKGAKLNAKPDLNVDELIAFYSESASARAMADELDQNIARHIEKGTRLFPRD